MNKKLFGVIVLSVITVAIWIGYEVWTRLGSDEIQLNYEGYLGTINTDFDDETMKELSFREEEYMMIEGGDLD